MVPDRGKLLREDQPDLMAVMFDGTDGKIQHQAWAFLVGEGAATDDPERNERLRRLCHRYFANVDGYIARLAALAGPEAQIFLASDHGFTGSRRSSGSTRSCAIAAILRSVRRTRAPQASAAIAAGLPTSTGRRRSRIAGRRPATASRFVSQDATANSAFRPVNTRRFASDSWVISQICAAPTAPRSSPRSRRARRRFPDRRCTPHRT